MVLQRAKYGSAGPASPKTKIDSSSQINLMHGSMMSTQHMEGVDGSHTPGPNNYLLQNDDSDYFNHNFINSASIVTPKHSMLMQQNRKNGSRRNRSNMMRSSMLQPIGDHRVSSLHKMSAMERGSHYHRSRMQANTNLSQTQMQMVHRI